MTTLWPPAASVIRGEMPDYRERLLIIRLVRGEALAGVDVEAQAPETPGLALDLLAKGAPVKAVAPAVGYETTSAFVAAFRADTGVTPGSYFRAAAREPVPQGTSQPVGTVT